jgi:hypothetical protein
LKSETVRNPPMFDVSFEVKADIDAIQGFAGEI